MGNSPKLTECMPCHLTIGSADAVKNLALSKDISVSEWIRQLVERELSRELLQAQSTLRALSSLANEQNAENAKNGDQ